VTVNAISTNPTSATASTYTICNGGSTTLTLNGGGGGVGAVIHWYSGSCGGTAVGTGNNLAVSPTATITYYGRWEDACGNNTTCQSLTITVNSTTGGIGVANNDAVIYISSGTTFYISGTGGNYWNYSGCSNNASINNAGTLKLDGNWSNSASNNVFIADAGTTILNGGAQSIGGTTQTDFFNLTLSGTAGSTKTMAVNTQVGGSSIVTGTLALGDHPLNLGGYTLIISNPSITTAYTRSAGGYVYINSYPDKNFTNKIQWNIGSTTGAHIFPFGRDASNNWIPFTFTLNSGTIGNVTVSTYSAKTNGSLADRPTVVPNLDYCFPCTDNSGYVAKRYWLISPSGSGNADVTYTYVASDEEAVSGSGPYWAQRFNTGTTKWDNPGYGTGSAGTVTATGITNFSPWALARKSSPLPVELLNFDANCDGNKVDLNWSTASETNNDYFSVSKSKDLTNWYNVGTVDGSGTANTLHLYDLTDNAPFLGKSYYTLKQVDFDGNSETFDPVSTECIDVSENSFEIINVIPNETHDELTITFNVPDDGKSDIYIIDYLGQGLINKRNNSTKGLNVATVSLRHPLATGIYMVTIEHNYKIFTQKIFIH
jgi:hypothetical protein